MAKPRGRRVCVTEDSGTEYLLKATHSFRGQIIVVSPDFTILAVAGQGMEQESKDIVGKRCHEVLPPF